MSRVGQRPWFPNPLVTLLCPCRVKPLLKSQAHSSELPSETKLLSARLDPLSGGKWIVCLQASADSLLLLVLSAQP